MRLLARIGLCCLLAFMLGPMNAQENPPKIVLAIHATPQGNALYLETKLNGKPARLLLDTGSTVSLPSPYVTGNFAARLPRQHRWN